MAGLGPEGASPMPAQAPQQAQAPGLEQASPEEQATYDRFTSMALIALYDKKIAPKVGQMIKAAEDPVRAVADVASSVALRTFSQALEDGAEIPGDVLLHAGKEIVEATVEIAETVGQTFTPAMMEQAFYAAADTFAAGAEKMGVYTEDVMKDDMVELTAMKHDGRLDAIMAAMTAERDGGQEMPQSQQPAMRGLG